MRHLLIGLIALVIFLMLVLYASAKIWGEEPPTRAAPPVESALQLRLAPRSVLVFDTLYSGRTRVNPVQRQLLREGYGVAGKLPILPEKRDANLKDAAGNVLPSANPLRNLSGPLLGTERTTRDPLMRNRLSASERTEQQLYRGPSHPGMIAPRAQQQRSTPSARDLGR
ncbi:hypothetical protein Pan97_52490 [Bremerella volcania]|uniref:Uncharacterized protein n=1 Tax=Bremerella volcania TaxID=2527984 RepID=A0A518CG06_9BACT|nr:hypothetical protein [Bremerella volcania]QDU78166.1 hypothetical protein Pan97_52490 [Bremerella volcania]